MNEFSMTSSEEKEALDKIIRKSRVHLYKPIQIAEILYHDRVHGDIVLEQKETYRNHSKRWRDEVCQLLVGRTSTSSQKFQDDLFNENAVPPRLIAKLGEFNRLHNGAVEKYIYSEFKSKFSQMNAALEYCTTATTKTFDLETFLNLFRNDPGLKRSVDKIYEIVVFALFSALIESMEMSISIKIQNSENKIFAVFNDFSEKVLGITKETISSEYPAKLFRVGITNAADRGLDMWGNFGLAIQIKHLSLTEEVARDVSNSVNADRIIIVCKDAEEHVILNLLNQLGWRAKIQAVVTLSELRTWYSRALDLVSHPTLGKSILEILSSQIKLEFPSSENEHLSTFFSNRGY